MINYDPPKTHSAAVGSFRSSHSRRSNLVKLLNDRNFVMKDFQGLCSQLAQLATV
jgi:hypothetical protein